VIVEVEHRVEFGLNLVDNTRDEFARRDCGVLVGVVAGTAALAFLADHFPLVVEFRQGLSNGTGVEASPLRYFLARAVGMLSQVDVNPRPGLGVENPREQVDDALVERLDGAVGLLFESLAHVDILCEIVLREVVFERFVRFVLVCWIV